jgi:hypothetical protein
MKQVLSKFNSVFLPKIPGLLIVGVLAVISRTLAPSPHAVAGSCIRCQQGTNHLTWCQIFSTGANVCWTPTPTTCSTDGVCS